MLVLPVCLPVCYSAKFLPYVLVEVTELLVVSCPFVPSVRTAFGMFVNPACLLAFLPGCLWALFVLQRVCACLPSLNVYTPV